MYVFLTGAPGAGKSTVAPELAALLGANVFELDALIERRAGPIARIFEVEGEARFRDLEREALAGLDDGFAWTVVSTGGGAVLDPANRGRMRALGVIVGMEADRATLLARTRNGARPLLAGDGPARLDALLRERRAAYADADLHVRTDERPPREIARALAAALVAGRGVDVPVGEGYRVHVHAGGLDEIGAVAAGAGLSRRVALVTDATLARRLGLRARRSLAARGIAAELVRIPTGERAKTPRVLAALWRAFARLELGRDDGVVALGGGSVSDLAGFAAATYARGIRWIAIPTTLLAQVDAAIGGKTAVDLPEGKNLAGSFHDPAAVLADPAVLATLADREIRSGLAEVVKAAVVGDAAFVAQLERTARALAARDEVALFAAIVGAVRVKSAIVARDPREAGERLALNLGHTLGHALEAASGYRRYAHGEAVSLGLVFACALAEELELSPAGLRERVETLLVSLGLPVRVRVPAAAWRLLARDKKRRAGKLRWVLPRRLGTVSVVEDVPDRAVSAAARVLASRRR